MKGVAVHHGELVVGHLHRHAAPGGERTSFRYDAAWLGSAQAFSIDPELPLERRTFAPSKGGLFGAGTS